MAIMKTERLIAHDGTIQEERNFDGFGKLVSKRKNVKPATQTIQNSQEKKQMTKKFIANVPPQEEPLGVPGVNGYMELKFHSSGIGYTTLSQMIQQELNRLEQDDMFLTLREIYDNHCIYFSSTDNKLYKRDYTVTDGTVELADNVQEVQEKIEYRPTNQQAAQQLPLLANGDVKLLCEVNGAVGQTEAPLLPLGFGFDGSVR